MKVLVERDLGDLYSQINISFNFLTQSEGTIHTLGYRASLCRTSSSLLELLYDQPEPYERMKPLPSAQEYLNEIRADGDEPVLYTKCNRTYIEKWLSIHFPTETLSDIKSGHVNHNK